MFHKFFVAQISLLVAMCKGNVKIIETLQSDSKVFGVKIDFELVMSAIIDQNLRASYPALVAALIELLKGLCLIAIDRVIPTEQARVIIFFYSYVC